MVQEEYTLLIRWGFAPPGSCDGDWQEIVDGGPCEVITPFCPVD
ncbi:hypothetical protein J2129_001624 [Methanofollis sp. W23]|nr:hypothetical protein [Methanofollis sp. W23]MBP2146170.1 hypothetical protein [Methanofollis sp. W23]